MSTIRPTLLDRVIGHFNPRAGLERQRSRIAMHIARDYEAASKGRRTGAWGLNSTSADAEIEMSGPALRNRMRALVRNNAHAARAVAVLAENIVGDGIMPRANTGDEAKNKKIDALFAEWASRCDADGQLDFAGIQTLAVREMVEGGEALVRRRLRTRNMTVPLQLQILEADHIDSAKTGALAATGSPTVQGIELTRTGTRAAYWLFPVHPGNAAAFGDTASMRVPATEICHLYEKQRTQVRGVPWGAPVINYLRDLGEYEDAELMRKKLDSCPVGVVVAGDEEDPGVGLPLKAGEKPGVYDSAGVPVERFEPGMFLHARGGRDIKFHSPSGSTGYSDYKRSILHTIAAGWRIPYELLTGDLKEVSFISGRMGLIEFRRFVSQVQWQIVIPMMLQPIWEWFVDAAYLAGAIDADTIPVEWSPPMWTTIDPKADAEADISDMRAGIRSPQDVIAGRGRNPDTVLAEIAEWNAKIDKLAIVLDSDPRNTTQAGQQQMQGQAQDPGGTAPKPAPKKTGT